MKKRMGYLKLMEEVEMTNLGLQVRAYSKRGKFLGRLEINRAGVEPFIGVHGTKSLGNMSWESFFERLSKKKE